MFLIFFFSDLEPVGSGPSFMPQLMEFSIIFNIAFVLYKMYSIVCEHLFDCDQPVMPAFWCMC